MEINMRDLYDFMASFSLVKQAEVHPYLIDKSYFIRTVTHYYTGILVAVYDKELVINNAAWIADTGRFADALANREFSEVEPFPDGPVIIGRGAIIDAVRLEDFAPPRKQK